jgi:hypothetical protein
MICKQKEIHSLDFFVSFFVKKKRKESKIIAQIEIIGFFFILVELNPIQCMVLENYLMIVVLLGRL